MKMIYRALNNRTPEALAHDGQHIIDLHVLGDDQFVVMFDGGTRLNARAENITIEDDPRPRDTFGRWVPSDSDGER